MSGEQQRAVTFTELLQRWLPTQRWFAAKRSGAVQLTRVGGMQLPVHVPGDLAPAGHVEAQAVRVEERGTLPSPALLAAGGPVAIEVHLVEVTSDDGTSSTYQVPLTYRAEPEPSLAAALVGIVEHRSLGTRWVYDGPHDPAFVSAWLALVATGGEALPEPGSPRSRVRGVRSPGAPPLDPSRSGRVLAGEQSNTSVIIGAEGDATTLPVIMKLFRVLQAGRNPDVVVTGALTAAGCEQVPQLLGWVEGEWSQPDGTPAWGHLSAVAEFVAGSEDGWRLACRAVDAGTGFGAEAGELGAATASVHAALSRALPTRPMSPAALEELARHLEQRLAWAVDAAPALAEHAKAAAAVVAAVRSVGNAPDLQIIHGDLHLGQALYGTARGWVLLDFEGEPLRPLAERGAPDLALRDVAGMLRSFDYAAGHSTIGLPDDDHRTLAAASWASACREAFLDGYATSAKRDPRDDAVLLRALELDKALYEAVYETRHRPSWLEVPLRAVARLLA